MEDRAIKNSIIISPISFLVFVLLSHHAIADEYHRSVEYKMYRAIEAGNLNRVKALVEKGFDVNSVVDDSIGETPLDLAAYCGNTEICRYLIDQGARIDPSSVRGTPLHSAAWMGHVNVVNLLLSKGANINAVSKRGEYPLHMAVRGFYGEDGRGERCFKVAKLLIEKGAKIDLHIASALCETDVVKLLREGLDVNKKDDRHNTPLHNAAQFGRAEAAKILLNYGAGPNAINKDGLTPLHHAAGFGHTDLIELLIDSGANTEIDCGGGDGTPLYAAVGYGQEDAVRLLIAKGANINKRSLRLGGTPLESAVGRGYSRIVELLILNGADVNATDSDGKTPLYWARKRGRDGVAKILRKHGAVE